MNTFVEHPLFISLFSFIFLMVMLAECIVPIHHNVMMADAVMMAASSFISICLLNTNVCCLLLPSAAAILNHVNGVVGGGVGGVNVVQRNSFEVMSGVMGGVMGGVVKGVVSGALMEPFDGCRSGCELRSG